MSMSREICMVCKGLLLLYGVPSGEYVTSCICLIAARNYTILSIITEIGCCLCQCEKRWHERNAYASENNVERGESEKKSESTRKFHNILLSQRQGSSHR